MLKNRPTRSLLALYNHGPALLSMLRSKSDTVLSCLDISRVCLGVEHQTLLRVRVQYRDERAGDAILWVQPLPEVEEYSLSYLTWPCRVGDPQNATIEFDAWYI